MFELAECIKLAVAADEVNLYLVENEGELTKYAPEKGKRRPVYQIGEGTTIAAYTAFVKEEVRVELPTKCSKYPHGVAGKKVSSLPQTALRMSFQF